MDINNACGPVAAYIVLDALIRDEEEPGYLKKVGEKAEVLFRILDDTDGQKHERFADSMETLALVGYIYREIERSKMEGRFSLYP